MATKKKMGRPQAEINKTDFEKLCELQCTEVEIAGFFDVHIDTVNNWCKRTYGLTFSDTFKQKSAKGKISLRRKQWNLATKNAAMAIFLGKQYLDQRDGMDITTTEIGRVEELIKGIDDIAKV